MLFAYLIGVKRINGFQKFLIKHLGVVSLATPFILPIFLLTTDQQILQTAFHNDHKYDDRQNKYLASLTFRH